jgi:hypothetical protein
MDTQAAQPTNTLRVFGRTQDGRLVRFRTDSPQTTKTRGVLRGFQSPDTALIGMDFRVQDGLLYGVGNGGGVYTIDLQTAQLTFVNTLTVPLLGTFFGVDFSPPANRLRIISDAGQNLAHDVTQLGSMATVAQTMLSYAPSGTPVALGVTGAAYTNNDLDATTGTVLYDIDPTRGQVVVQAPSGAGLLTVVGQLGVQVDPQTPVGFDIYSRLNNGQVAVQNRAYASLVVNGAYGFYQINLTTGQATLLGAFNDPIVDLAIPLNQ